MSVLSSGAGHAQFAVLNCKGHSPFNKINGIAAELFKTPPVQNRQFIPDSSSEHFQIIRPGQQSGRSEEHTSELQSLMRISYAVFCLKKKKNPSKTQNKSIILRRPPINHH